MPLRIIQRTSRPPVGTSIALRRRAFQLNAAAWTYVAGTLQAVLTLLYFIMRFGGSNRD